MTKILGNIGPNPHWTFWLEDISLHLELNYSDDDEIYNRYLELLFSNCAIEGSWGIIKKLKNSSECFNEENEMNKISGNF